jgi:hypothetical protein
VESFFVRGSQLLAQLGDDLGNDLRGDLLTDSSRRLLAFLGTEELRVLANALDALAGSSEQTLPLVFGVGA